MGSLGTPVPHDSAREHVRGEAAYVADLPPVHGELWVDFVASPVAHGRITSVDYSDALKSPGIACVIAAKDIPGHNIFGPIVKDEHLLAADEAVFLGDPILILAAQTREQLKAAHHFDLTDAWLDHVMKASVKFGGASGSFVSADGLVLTCYHVVRGATKVFVRLPSGKGSYADIHAADPRSDLAVLRLLNTKLALKAVCLGETSSARTT